MISYSVLYEDILIHWRYSVHTTPIFDITPVTNNSFIPFTFSVSWNLCFHPQSACVKEFWKTVSINLHLVALNWKMNPRLNKCGEKSHWAPCDKQQCSPSSVPWNLIIKAEFINSITTSGVWSKTQLPCAFHHLGRSSRRCSIRIRHTTSCARHQNRWRPQTSSGEGSSTTTCHVSSKSASGWALICGDALIGLHSPGSPSPPPLSRHHTSSWGGCGPPEDIRTEPWTQRTHTSWRARSVCSQHVIRHG